MSFILDIIVVFIIISAVLYGLRKGLILTVAEIAITIVSIMVAWIIASAFSPLLANVVEDSYGAVIGNAVNAAVTEGGDMLPDISALTRESISAATADVLGRFGFSERSDNPLISAIMHRFNQTWQSFTSVTNSTVSGALAFSGLLIFGFIFVRAGLEVAAHYVLRIFDLPLKNI